MKRMRLRMGGIVLVVSIVLGGGVRAFPDGGTGATSTDAYARERVAEFQDIAKKKKRSIKDKDRQLAIVRELARAPCRTSQKFLGGILKKKSSAGDHRLHALRSLLHMADEKSLGKALSALQKAKDETLWQVFGESLLDRPSDAVSAWVKGPALGAKDPALLCGVLEALSRKADATLTPRVAALYEKHAGTEKGSVDVAYQALRVLVRGGVDVSRAPLLQAAGHADWRLRLAAADALPSIVPFEKEVVAAVRGLIQDDSPIVRRAAIQGAGRFKRKALADLVIARLTDKAGRTRQVAALALKAMSGGQQLGQDAKAWARWLAKQDPGKPVDLAFPTYHGVTIHSSDVVFVVDASSSMTWPWRKKIHRIDIALSELKRALGDLTSDMTFNVMVFSEKNTSWKKQSVPATPKNTAAAASWAAKAMAKPAGDTFLYEALRDTFERHPDCDTIFLLTDGNPTAGTYWTVEGILASVKAWTRYRRTAINTIGLSLLNMDRGMPNLSEKPQIMKQIMKGIASATSGQFREILNQPK